MRASVAISYYKNTSNLGLILAALNKQTAKNEFEVIISEDGDAPESVTFINAVKSTFSFPIQHLTQEDKGFRKCKALNNVILKAKSDFIIFIDGDCIPHKKWVHEYLKAKKDGRVLFGRRVMLSEKFSQELATTKALNKLNFYNLITKDTERIEEGFYLSFLPQRFTKKENGILLGCNMGIFKKDLIAINGFDEDYESPGGGEDSDIEWRLKALGNISFYSLKFKAIVFHIYHKVRFAKGAIMPNDIILQQKKEQGFFFCKNGIKKIV
jgi:glycosyltransferase involved in cell wall biosynthesis